MLDSVRELFIILESSRLLILLKKHICRMLCCKSAGLFSMIVGIDESTEV